MPLEWMFWYNGRGFPGRCATQLSLSNKRSLNSPSQPDREGSTATRRKSKTSTPISDTF